MDHSFHQDLNLINLLPAIHQDHLKIQMEFKFKFLLIIEVSYFIINSSHYALG